jgi:hemolysin activation/secretion protein
MRFPSAQTCGLTSRLIIGLLAIAAPFPALGQSTAGSQLPPGEEVGRATTPPVLDFRIGGVLSAPPGAETALLSLSAVKLEGGIAELQPRIAGLLPAAGTGMTLADIYGLAARIQEGYLQAGYPLVRVFVPVQDLDRANARVRIKVVSGFVSTVDVSGVPEAVRQPISALTAPLMGRQPLTARELERAVLLAGEVAGVSLRSTLMAGTSEGETRLILTADHARVQALVSADNQLARDLGEEQVTISTAFNGLLRRGDRFGFTIATAASNPSLSDDATRRYVGMFFDTLVGSSGLALGADVALSTSRPGGAVAFLALQNEFRRAGLSATYPLARTRNRTSNARLGFDMIKETQASGLLGTPVILSRDETRVMRFGYDQRVTFARAAGAGATIGFDLEYSRGIDGLGARSQADATVLEPLSRDGADAAFGKLNGGLFMSVPVGQTPATLALTARAQTAFGEPLLRSEQASIAAPELLPGVPVGSVVGDSAYAGRLSVDWPVQLGLVAMTPYAFLAAGQTTLHQPTAFELPETRLSGTGVGVRFGVPIAEDYGLTLRLEASRTSSNAPELDDDHLTVRIAIRR